MIKTIIFDLSEVYLSGLLGTNKILSKRLGTNIASSDLHIPEIQQLFEGKISEDRYWESILLKHRWNISIGELKKIVRSNFKEINGVRKIIERLKKNGYQLGLLSVHAKEWIEYCEKEFDHHKLFDSTLYSFDVAVCKPDKRAYELILEKLNVRAEECLFIDDSLQNLDSARELGIQTILFTSAEQLLDELKRRGIKSK